MWTAILLVVLLACIVVRLRRAPHMTWAAAPNGAVYWVRNVVDRHIVAERLALLHDRLRRLVEGIRASYPGDPRLAALERRWNGTIAEVERPGDIAYSINKRAVYLCVRDARGQLENVESTTYVLLHEVAHVLTDTYGHPPEFWRNFRWLVELAERMGLYKYQDFDAAHVTHCGHRLGNNVVTCVRDRKCASEMVLTTR